MNIDDTSKRSLGLILAWTVVIGLTSLMLPNSSAAELLFDDFEDGSFTDGTPAQWNATELFAPHAAATAYVENGALVLDSITDGTFIKADLQQIGSTDGSLLEVSDTWSIRTQFRILDFQPGNIVHAGIGTTALEGAFLFVSGDLGLGWNFNVTTAPTDFDEILDRDFVIQLDVERDLLRGHVWPVDDPANIVSAEFADLGRLSRPLIFNSGTVAAYEYVQVSLEPIPICLPGDFDCNGAVELSDIDLLLTAVRTGEFSRELDLDTSAAVDASDINDWVGIKGTWIGDANLDGLFESGDLVEVFRAGQYEDDVEANSTWATGDWNGDGEFDTGDLVVAFQGGGYEAGQRAAVVAVPEPSAILPVLVALPIIVRMRNGSPI